MPYATLGDLLPRYRPIETMVGTGSWDVSSSDVASVYIYQVEAYINAYLGQRYAVPFPDPVNPLITQITADLAIFFMLAERMPSVPDFMDQRRQRADELLKQLAGGQLVVASATMVTSAGDSFAWSPSMGHTPIFSPFVSAETQRPDPDRVNAELDARGRTPWADDRC